MKKIKVITVYLLSALLLTLLSQPAMATPPSGGYKIDGDLSDWGVNPGSDWNSETAKVQVEENYVWPFGKNPGIEEADIEAMYIDEDNNGPWIYFAIVTSMPELGIPHPYDPGNSSRRLIPGDLALDLYPPHGDFSSGDSYKRYGFEYGVKLTSYNYSSAGKGTPVVGNIGSVFKDPVWEKITDYYAQNRARFSNMVQGSSGSSDRSVLVWTANTNPSNPDIIYKEDDWMEGTTKNYVIELRIPKSALGISNDGELDLMATQSCTNDIITAVFAYTKNIPEFPTMAFPVIAVIGLMFLFQRRKGTK